MKVINYNFHNILRVKIVLHNTTPFDKYLAETFRGYKVEEIPNSDLTFILGNFDSNNSGCKSKNDFLIKENYIYHRFDHKINSMEMEINGLEDSETIVRISSGWINTFKCASHILFPLIKFKLARKGYPALFASSVANKTGAIVLSAKGRTGKTSMVLWAIKHGFGFLGDGSVILGGNKVYNFITPLNLFANHFPLIKDSLGLKTRLALWRNELAYLLLGEKHKLFARINITDIFPDCLVKESSPVHICLLQRRGDKMVIDDDVDNTAAIKEMVSIHKNTDSLISKMLSAYTSVFTDSKLVNYWDNLETELACCLKHTKFHRITYPEKYSIDLVDQVFDRICSKDI